MIVSLLCCSVVYFLYVLIVFCTNQSTLFHNTCNPTCPAGVFIPRTGISVSRNGFTVFHSSHQKRLRDHTSIHSNHHLNVRESARVWACICLCVSAACRDGITNMVVPSRGRGSAGLLRGGVGTANSAMRQSPADVHNSAVSNGQRLRLRVQLLLRLLPHRGRTAGPTTGVFPLGPGMGI
jgi:hypothetical protein